jgi:hypothetical protein
MHESDDITQAARAMTSAEPPVDLEARIKARLDSTMTTPTRSWFDWRAGLAATAVTAIAVVAVGVVQESKGPEVQGSKGPGVQEFKGPGVQGSKGPRVQEFKGPEVQGSKGPRVQEFKGPRVQGSKGPGGMADLGTSEAELAWMARQIPALDTVEPMVFDAPAFESIQPKPLAITPLSVTPIEISPVTGNPDRM